MVFPQQRDLEENGQMGKQPTRASIQWHIKSDFKALVFQSALTKDWPMLWPPLQRVLVLGTMQTARTSACVDAWDIGFYLRFALRIRVDSKGLYCWHYLLKESEIFIMPSNKRQAIQSTSIYFFGVSQTTGWFHHRFFSSLQNCLDFLNKLTAFPIAILDFLI